MKIILYVAVLVVAYFFLAGSQNGRAEVIFFDVGQGDAWLMKTKLGKVILVDGGPDWKLIPQLDEYLGPRGRKIDIMIATHAHSDHLASLPEIVERYEVISAIVPAVFPGNEASSLLSALASEGAEVVRLRGSRCLSIEADCSICIYAGSQEAGDDENDHSLVTRWDCDDLSVLGTGDAGMEREAEYLAETDINEVDVLKIGHHGSDTSSSREFLETLSPIIAVISVGKDNNYGHPSQKTLNKLGDMSVRSWRSDQEGSIKIYANNNKIYAEKWP